MENETPLADERIKTWKVETTSTGIILAINGKRYHTHAGEALAFDIQHAASGLNGTYGGES